MTAVERSPSTEPVAAVSPELCPLTDEQKQFRTHLQECEARNWQHFDDLVFKFSAGGLGLSVTLLGVMRGEPLAGMPWVYGAWSLWAGALLVLLFSVLTGQRGLRSQIAHLDARTYYRVSQPEGRVGALTPWLNNSAAVMCGSGLCFLLVFSVMNISGGRTMTNRNLQEGIVAPQAPAAQPGGVEQRGQVSPQAPAPTSIAPTVPGGAGQVAPQAPPPQTPRTPGGR